MQSFPGFVFVLIFNLWIWIILSQNILIGITTLTASLLLFLLPNQISKLFFVAFALLLYFQWSTTPPSSLTKLDNDEQRIQQDRLNMYPPTYIQFSSHTLWVPLAHWLEGRRETIAFYRIEKNFFQAIDPSLYFFVNHPRERFGVKEFEKFPYVLLPFFLVGIVKFFQRRTLLATMSFVIPIALISYIGNQNPMSNFILFPALSVSLALGIGIYLDYIRKYKKYILLGNLSLLAFLLVFLQTIIYQISN